MLLMRIRVLSSTRNRLFKPRPDYTTSSHSLFLMTEEGAQDDMHLVDPPEASRELYQVLNLLAETCPSR